MSAEAFHLPVPYARTTPQRFMGRVLVMILMRYPSSKASLHTTLNTPTHAPHPDHVQKTHFPSNAVLLCEGVLNSGWETAWSSETPTPQRSWAAVECFVKVASSREGGEGEGDRWGALRCLWAQLVELKHVREVMGLNMSVWAWLAA